MKNEHLLKKIVLLLILAFINYSCFSDHIISKKKITEEDSTKVIKMILTDGGEYNLHTNDFIIENDIIKIKGENGSSVPFSDIKVVKVHEFDLGGTVLLALTAGLTVWWLYSIIHHMKLLGGGPILEGSF